jgi:uncharacterized protein
LSALVRIAGLTGDSRWLARVDAHFKALSAPVQGNLLGHAGILNALDFRLRAKEIVTAGRERKALYRFALGVPFTGRILLDIEKEEDFPAGHPARAQAELAGEAAAAFVCSNETCSLPLRDKETLLDKIGYV